MPTGRLDDRPLAAANIRAVGSVIAHQQIDLPLTRVGRDWMGPQSVEGICSYVGSNGPGSVKRSIDSTFA